MLRIAVKAARQAGKILLDMQKDISVETKKDGSPVTAADKAASKSIANTLRPTNTPVLGEETFSETPQASKMWVVDPLDGTSEFIKGSDEYTVNIAFVEDGVPQFGVVHVPRLEMTYYGGITTPSKKIVKGVEKNIAVSQTSNIGVTSVSYPDERVQDLYEEIGVTDHASVGSSLKGCYVAEGRVGVYARFHNLYEWDVCAMHAVLEGANGVFSYLDGSQVIYGKENPRMKPFMMGRAEFVRRALK